jgi:DNA (cytosine-5)-methyltransferase 1
MTREIKVIDLFAGPGGLGEGFSAYKHHGENPFNISLSVEKEASAHQTLTLRAFYRQFQPASVPDEYYEFLAGKLGNSPDEQLYKLPIFRKQVSAARAEAQLLELGKNNRTINQAIENVLGPRPGNWVLIGGPPCQAYSVIGRSRNRGIKDYTPEDDHRSYLYKEYLRVIAKFRPAVFVMENVKGLLSANVDGEHIFHKILDDLRCPARAVRGTDRRADYHVVPLVVAGHLIDLFDEPSEPGDFVVCAEHYGVPQARHRVILLGIRDGLAKHSADFSLKPLNAPTVRDAIEDLPCLRSGLSQEKDSFAAWVKAIKNRSDRIIAETEKIGMTAVADKMTKAIARIGKIELGRGSNWSSETTSINTTLPLQLRKWYRDESGWRGVCNHEARGHIAEDLHRYLFCACYGKVANNGNYTSPSSAAFPKMLAPKHSNWNTGHFSDRYRVQLATRPGTTVTSHISKDGHYFIHYDPSQCRSLTVREAARIQTFPDNYFFVGYRTEQYVQVGNAVPPFLATKIADAVFRILVMR